MTSNRDHRLHSSLEAILEKNRLLKAELDKCTADRNHFRQQLKETDEYEILTRLKDGLIDKLRECEELRLAGEKKIEQETSNLLQHFNRGLGNCVELLNCYADILNKLQSGLLKRDLQSLDAAELINKYCERIVTCKQFFTDTNSHKYNLNQSETENDRTFIEKIGRFEMPRDSSEAICDVFSSLIASKKKLPKNQIGSSEELFEHKLLVSIEKDQSSKSFPSPINVESMSEPLEKKSINKNSFELGLPDVSSLIVEDEPNMEYQLSQNSDQNQTHDEINQLFKQEEEHLNPLPNTLTGLGSDRNELEQVLKQEVEQNMASKQGSITLCSRIQDALNILNDLGKESKSLSKADMRKALCLVSQLKSNLTPNTIEEMKSLEEQESSIGGRGNLESRNLPAASDINLYNSQYLRGDESKCEFRSNMAQNHNNDSIENKLAEEIEDWRNLIDDLNGKVRLSQAQIDAMKEESCKLKREIVELSKTQARLDMETDMQRAILQESKKMKDSLSEQLEKKASNLKGSLGIDREGHIEGLRLSKSKGSDIYQANLPYSFTRSNVFKLDLKSTNKKTRKQIGGILCESSPCFDSGDTSTGIQLLLKTHNKSAMSTMKDKPSGLLSDRYRLSIKLGDNYKYPCSINQPLANRFSVSSAINSGDRTKKKHSIKQRHSTKEGATRLTQTATNFYAELGSGQTYIRNLLSNLKLNTSKKSKTPQVHIHKNSHLDRPEATDPRLTFKKKKSRKSIKDVLSSHLGSNRSTDKHVFATTFEPLEAVQKNSPNIKLKINSSRQKLESEQNPSPGRVAYRALHYIHNHKTVDENNYGSVGKSETETTDRIKASRALNKYCESETHKEGQERVSIIQKDRRLPTDQLFLQINKFFSAALSKLGGESSSSSVPKNDKEGQTSGLSCESHPKQTKHNRITSE